jgi:uncharacterized OB-fold protein
MSAKPALPCIKTAADGAPYIEGLRCRTCSAVMPDQRLACPACGSRAGFDGFKAAETGVLHAYSIVRRSFPGVEVPFISAVVDLDDGLTLKGNLLGVAPEPEALTPNLRVKLVFGDALGRTDKEGSSYIAYFFEPAAA